MCVCVCVIVCLCEYTASVALHHIDCLVAAIWHHAIRVPPSEALALANMAGERRRGRRGEGLVLVGRVGEIKGGLLW